MAVASSDGGNLLSVASVNPVNGGRKPLCNAVFNVDNAVRRVPRVQMLPALQLYWFVY